MKKFFESINITPKQLLYLFLLVIMVVFVIQNAEAVRFRFLFFGFEMPLIIIIVAAFIIGFFAARVFPKRKVNKQEPSEEPAGNAAGRKTTE
ncbi:MAG: lipopolysaccharide assembly protein LapA domain-containing protein [Tenuifilaceae bacterium]|jgi:uncharacterized integral membrane protein|nr:lipopolysaccharide assembly protein LapA domain-containing protein [Tenuifilaceae bacterium]